MSSRIEAPTEGTRITINSDGTLNVSNDPIICFIEGDGIGPDIWASAQRVLDHAVAKAYNGEKKVVWHEVYAGEKAYEKFGEWLPQDTLDNLENYNIAIKGPLTTPVGGGFRSLNVAIRQRLDLYACVRPVQWFTGVPSPVKCPEKVNMVIFRENSEDIYAGIEWAAGSDEVKRVIDFLQNEMKVENIRFPETSGIGIKPVSQEGTDRIVRAAIQHAVDHDLPSVTLVHKGNIMKFTEGGFKTWGYECAEREYGDKVFTWAQYDHIAMEDGPEAANKAQNTAIAAGKIIVKDCIADAFLQQILTRPTEYSVIATLNLNGDYISDALAAQVGGIGIAPGANINYDSGTSVYEATHGTAPKYKGLDKVNPSSVILSGEMMFRRMGWDAAADLIVKGISQSISDKQVTYDFHRLMEGATLLKCSEYGTAVIARM